MRVSMIATKAMTYATRQLRADEPFEASRMDARVLTALGRAKLVEPKPEPKNVEAEKDALDHDGNGKKGGSAKGETATRRRARQTLTVKTED